MAASGSKAVFGDVYIDDVSFVSCGNGVELSKPCGVFFSDKRRPSCLKAGVRMIRGSSNSYRALPSFRGGLFCGDYGFDSIKRNLCSGSERGLHVSSSARDVSLEGNSREEQSLVDVNLVSGQYVLLPFYRFCILFAQSFVSLVSVLRFSFVIS